MMVWKIAPALACGNTIVIKVGQSQTNLMLHRFLGCLLEMANPGWVTEL